MALEVVRRAANLLRLLIAEDTTRCIDRGVDRLKRPRVWTLRGRLRAPLFYGCGRCPDGSAFAQTSSVGTVSRSWLRSEEHTSELQSQSNLVCRLLLEKKKKKKEKQQT